MQGLTVILFMTMGTQALSLRFRWDCNRHQQCCCNKGKDPSEEWLKWNSVSSAAFEVPGDLQLPNVKVSEPFQCHANRNGPLNSRSSSPWSYELDRDENRLPQDLYHARCLCPHCVNLQTGFIDYYGNSQLLWQNQTVFYRRKCPSHSEQSGSDCYYLERKVYPVSFACICVLPQVMA